jgi:hypothetical protein
MVRKFVGIVALCTVLPVSAALAHGPVYAIHHLSEPAVSADMGRIYFYRESSIAGVVLEPTIKLDGVGVGDSESGRYFYIDRPAGTYTVSTSTEKEETTTVTVTAGQTVYVKTSVSMGFFVGHVSPEVVPSDTAAQEIRDCEFNGTDAPAATPPMTQSPASPTPAAQAPTPQTPAAPTSQPPATTPPSQPTN